MNNKLKGMVRRVEAATSQDIRFFLLILLSLLL